MSKDKESYARSGNVRCNNGENLSFFTWNVYGISQDKLDMMFDVLNKFDVILLTECWTSKSDEYSLEGFEYFNFPRSFRHVNAKRNSGGMCTFVRDTIRKGIKVGRFSEETVHWLIFDKNYFGLKRNLHVGNAYIVPETSPFYRFDAFDIIEKDIDRLNPDEDVIVCGDLNAYSNVELDYIIDPYGRDLEFMDNPEINDICQFNKENMDEIKNLHDACALGRFSCDKKKLNTNGKDLINLCKSRGLLIINGRISEDTGIGEYTRYDHLGSPSVVDYVLANARLFKQFNYFKVQPKVPESDHLPITFSIGCNKIKSENTVCDKLQFCEPLRRIHWENEDLEKINNALDDDISLYHLNAFRETMSDFLEPDNVGLALTAFINQAITRVCSFQISQRKSHNKRKQGPVWFDTELRTLRSKAVCAGERVVTDTDRNNAMTACKQYRSTKQKKIRKFKENCSNHLHKAFLENKSGLWNVLNKISNKNRQSQNEPSLVEFTEYFQKLSENQQADYFDYTYERDAIKFLHQYDNMYSDKSRNNVELEIINSNFTEEEIIRAINYLRNNKSPGLDGIPAEIIKQCKNSLANHIADAFNYIIEKREFPKSWSEGVRSAVFKSGKINNVENYRGITILPILEKIFEISVYKRLKFVNEAFNKIDESNGGFLPGRRTADNLFILQGIIQKQLIIGKSVILCFVDFSKAFDLVNRNILFYKIMKSGWYGKVIDTLRSLYSHTSYRVKKNGWISFLIKNVLGVNQGGVASGLLFRKYLSDLSDYLNSKFGICVGKIIIMHILWADDLVLITDEENGMQRHLDGLLEFCKNNLAIVNEIKTKCMAFGKIKQVTITFNGKIIEQVDRYKCLGNVISPISRCNGDPFKFNAEYLCDKARKAIYAMSHRTRNISNLSPQLKFYLFNTLVLPILTYGSEIWSVSKLALKSIDKVFLRHIRCALSIKATTSNVISIGETGQYPPSVACITSLLNYANRLHHMPESVLAKKVYNELKSLNGMGFQTWTGDVDSLLDGYNLDVACKTSVFKVLCKRNVRARFRENWYCDLYDMDKNPILRTYNLFKASFNLEPYLILVKEHKYRAAIARLRSSSHTLAIERRRYERPKPPIEQRVCVICTNVVEDEIHFVTRCKVNQLERSLLESKVSKLNPTFMSLDEYQKFVFLNQSDDARILTWYGKFLHNSFNARNIYQSMNN